MNYKPSRDIPKAVKQLKTTSPIELRKWIMEHRTEKDPKTGRKVQKVVTRQSISMFFKRNSELRQQLERYIKKEEVVDEGISEGLFQNGVFDEISSIKRWLLKMRGRGAKEKSIRNFKGLIKALCLGKLPRTKKDVIAKRPRKTIKGWGIKHPNRITTRDCLEFLAEMQKAGIKYDRQHRLAFRNFLKANNVDDWEDISGEIQEDAGKYAYLFVPRPKINEIFDVLETMGEGGKEARDVSFFAFKTASRRNALLNAQASKYREERLPNGEIERTIIVLEKAVLHKSKRPQEKVVSEDLYEMLKPRLERGGKLFNIEANELCRVLRLAYEKVIPDLAREIPSPIHFWRHQFAQHLLRETGWNYGLVAKLGHWTVETLERYYGKMDRKVIMTEGRKHLPNI